MKWIVITPLKLELGEAGSIFDMIANAGFSTDARRLELAAETLLPALGPYTVQMVQEGGGSGKVELVVFFAKFQLALPESSFIELSTRYWPTLPEDEIGLTEELDIKMYFGRTEALRRVGFDTDQLLLALEDFAEIIYTLDNAAGKG